MKRIVCFILLIAMLLCGCGACPRSKDQAYFSHWNADAPALNALSKHVRAVTDRASPDDIPPADRIATFDMDGTLDGIVKIPAVYLWYKKYIWLRDLTCEKTEIEVNA